MKLPKNYLKYLIKFYDKCGLDIDYVDKLSCSECAFLCQFILENYGGMTDELAVKKRANHHRYATANDALVMKAVPSSEGLMEQDGLYAIDPETYLLLKERFLKNYSSKSALGGRGGRYSPTRGGRMKKNVRDRVEKYVEAQAFTMSVMQSLKETSTGERLAELASDAHDIAVESIVKVVETHPQMEKVVDRILKEIVVSNEHS